jgi:hypothetical protein
MTGVGVTGVMGDDEGAVGMLRLSSASALCATGGGGGGEMECRLRPILGGRAGGDSMGEATARLGLLSERSSGAQCVTEYELELENMHECVDDMDISAWLRAHSACSAEYVCIECRSETLSDHAVFGDEYLPNISMYALTGKRTNC